MSKPGRRIDMNILENMQEVFDLSPECMVLYEYPAGEIIYYNHSVYRFCESGQEENTDILKRIGNIREYSASGEFLAKDDSPSGRALFLGETVDNEEIIMELENGSRKWIVVSAIPVKDSKGKLIAVAKVWHDITRQKQAESKIDENENFDHLTGVYSRVKLMELAHRTFLRAENDGHPVAVLIIDIDGFRAVNDKYGHSAGDQVLHDFAEFLTGNFRTTDLFGRLGGTEFMVILPEITLKAAVEIAEKTRKIIEDMPFDTVTGVVSLTVSIGTAALDKKSEIPTFEQLYIKAEQALFEAINNGGNRTGIPKS